MNNLNCDIRLFLIINNFFLKKLKFNLDLEKKNKIMKEDSLNTKITY